MSELYYRLRFNSPVGKMLATTKDTLTLIRNRRDTARTCY
jgi:hypothetical protein